MLRFMGLIHCVDFCSIWQNQVHLKIWSCSFSASSRATPVTYPASTSVFSTNTDTHLLWLNSTSGSRIPAIKLEELAWFCRFESLLIRIVSNSWLLTHCSNKTARGPGSAGGTGRRRGVPQDARLPPATHQPQAALVLAASAPDLKQGKTVSWQKCCWSPFLALYQYLVLQCIVLSWVFPWLSSVSSWKMKVETLPPTPPSLGHGGNKHRQSLSTQNFKAQHCN